VHPILLGSAAGIGWRVWGKDWWTSLVNSLHRRQEGDLALNRTLNEIGVQHEYRMVEGEAMLQRNLIEQETAHRLRIAFLVNKHALDHSPFYDLAPEIARHTLLEVYAEEQKPILLIAPYWDESAPYDAGEAGGLKQFRTAITHAWERTPWVNDFTIQDGFLRPLHHTDRDIRIIREALHDLPVVLAWGSLDGHRAYPKIEMWNVIPSEHKSARSFFYAEGVLADTRQSFLAPEFRDALGRNVATICGMIAQGYYRLTDDRPIARELFMGEDRSEAERHLAAIWFDLIEEIARHPKPKREPKPKVEAVAPRALPAPRRIERATPVLIASPRRAVAQPNTGGVSNAIETLWTKGRSY
jgi:hypothetical protein